jgi:hypothetical protein
VAKFSLRRNRDSGNFAKSRFMIVVITGLIAGLIHVLTGPDHLTAIAPLAVRRPKAAWIPGVRFGDSAIRRVSRSLGCWRCGCVQSAGGFALVVG